MTAFEHFLVIVFRDQNLTPEQHKAFSRYFGRDRRAAAGSDMGRTTTIQESAARHEPENVVPSFENFHTGQPVPAAAASASSCARSRFPLRR
jgi:taurine dioxygenase